MGWKLSELETNSRSRLLLPSEIELNHRALEVVPHLWIEQGWNAIPLLVHKVADFWLSTDQLFDTGSLSRHERLVRVTGVSAYLLCLLLAAGGWLELRRTRPEMAAMFLVYAGGYTLLHLPLVMNTRLRIPLMEPLIVVLAGASWTRLTYAMGLIEPHSRTVLAGDSGQMVSQR